LFLKGQVSIAIALFFDPCAVIKGAAPRTNWRSEKMRKTLETKGY
jgi:hypothetical protein